MSDTKYFWKQSQAIELASEIEKGAPQFGAHVALTGGCLYKRGKRKDADFLFYRIRQVEEIDEAGLLKWLADNGLEIGERYGWVVKAKTSTGMSVDLFFPESKNNHLFPMRPGDTRSAKYFDVARNNEDLV